MSDKIDNLAISDEIGMRPKFLSEYIGQEKLKNNLKIFIGAAKAREETLDHVLFYGPPGLGKTSLANIIANEMETKLVAANGPSLEKIGDLAAILSEVEPGNILFIDEIHRIPKILEESLYNAMEDFKFQIVVDRDQTAKVITIDLPPFTLVGATTKIGYISSPLRSRFGIVEKLNYYSNDELSLIAKRTAKVFGCTIDNQSAYEIAKRSRGTPRITNRILKRVRDFANFFGKNHIDINDTRMALKALQIDELGLDSVDIKYLETLINRFKCGPVGLDTLSDAIGEEKTNLEEVYEPYLLQLGFIERTIKGRIANDKAIVHLKKLEKIKK